MKKLAIIQTILLLIVVGGYFNINKRGSHTNSQPEEVNEDATTPESRAPGKVVIRDVSDSEIVSVRNAEEAQELFEQLAYRLMTELEELQTTTHLAKIRSRITPTANQYYLLLRASEVAGIKPADFQQISSDQSDRVVKLIELWRRNQALGEEADRVYSRLGILDSEHLPFLLRRALEES